jgi:UDP-N-acetylglucosamine--N-acetylmuramyl-(pentapeptide) pyrophosphoryl-undecaprenol N-acetylglucosamine transferase
MDYMRVMICGGGTGGHITPALALTEYITRHHPHSVLWYTGRRNSMEERLTGVENISFVSLHAAPYRKGFGLLVCIAVNIFGLFESIFLILRRKPHIIVGFGGYASFPLLLAGLLLCRTVVVHEANALPGKSVRLLVRLGANFAYGIDTGNRVLKQLCNKAERKHGACFTGNPIRQTMALPIDLSRENDTGLNADAPTVLVMGGSQGARFLNRISCSACVKLREAVPGLQIIHITGDADEQIVRDTYEMCDIPHYVTSFSDRMNVLYALAGCVLARAGAMTIAEICAAAVPAVLVPFPYATEKHQHENARFLAENGGAVMIDQSDLTIERFIRELSSLMNDSDRMQRMAEINRKLAVPDAAGKLWEFALACQG